MNWGPQGGLYRIPLIRTGAELLEDPMRQTGELAECGGMNRRDWAALAHPRDDLALGIVEFRRLAQRSPKQAVRGLARARNTQSRTSSPTTRQLRA
jgi:hypothetical protein